jgi:hypothetical protein
VSGPLCTESVKRRQWNRFPASGGGVFWREHSATGRAYQAAYERMAADAPQRAERSRGLDVDGLEL